ncbi:unnamed protein product [Ascophyllum nodosum]
MEEGIRSESAAAQAGGAVPIPAAAFGTSDTVTEMGVWTSPQWMMGGAIAVLAAGSFQSKRRRRHDQRLRALEKERKIAIKELKKGLDLAADDFSCRNAFFLAHLSGMVYFDKDQCEGHFHDLGIEEFYWFSAPQDIRISLVGEFSEIANAQAAIGATPEYIAIVFRGTQEGADWITNLKFFHKDFPKLGRVHKGFNDALETVWIGEGMRDKLHEMSAANPRPIFVCGHSLGAALATIAVAKIAVEEDLPLTALYTMGSPRVFDTEGAHKFDKWVNRGKALGSKCFRGVNNNDIVTGVPPELFKIEGVAYKHVGKEIYINTSGAMGSGDLLDGLKGQCGACLRGATLGFVDDHSVGQYAAAFRRGARKAAHDLVNGMQMEDEAAALFSSTSHSAEVSVTVSETVASAVAS